MAKDVLARVRQRIAEARAPFREAEKKAVQAWREHDAELAAKHPEATRSSEGNAEVDAFIATSEHRGLLAARRVYDGEDRRLRAAHGELSDAADAALVDAIAKLREVQAFEGAWGAVRQDVGLLKPSTTVFTWRTEVIDVAATIEQLKAEWQHRAKPWRTSMPAATPKPPIPTFSLAAWFKKAAS
jgi:hypothetical protein